MTRTVPTRKLPGIVALFIFRDQVGVDDCRETGFGKYTDLCLTSLLHPSYYIRVITCPHVLKLLIKLDGVHSISSPFLLLFSLDLVLNLSFFHVCVNFLYPLQCQVKCSL